MSSSFDAGEDDRTEMYADYKAGRAKTPDEFREQLPFIREMLSHLGIHYYDLAQYEADDIIGTLDKDGWKKKLVTLRCDHQRR